MASFSGEFIAPASAREIYTLLVDPNRLVRCLPHLKRYEILDSDHFSVTVEVGLGRVRGPITMKMEILEKRENLGARIVGKGSLLNSQVVVDGSFVLFEASPNATRVNWEGDSKIGAYLAHLLGGLLNQLVQENVEAFVRALEHELGDIDA